MSNSGDLFSPSTWRVLGLSVAASFAGLGCTALVRPLPCAELLAIPSKNSDGTPNEAVADSMRLLAARDLSIAAALFAFDYQRKPHSMGVLILGGFILCAADIALVLSRKGLGPASMLSVGAAYWMAVGAGLVRD